jgi:hypothetical protein
MLRLRKSKSNRPGYCDIPCSCIRHTESISGRDPDGAILVPDQTVHAVFIRETTYPLEVDNREELFLCEEWLNTCEAEECHQGYYRGSAVGWATVRRNAIAESRRPDHGQIPGDCQLAMKNG